MVTVLGRMPVFVERHPNIMLKVTYGNSRDLSKKLLLGEIDLCIGSSRILTDPNFVSCSVLQDFYSIIIPENILNSYFHLSAEQAERGEMPDFNYLREAPLIMISGDSQTRAAGDHLLAQYKVIPPNVILECSGPDQGLLGAASGLGVCFAPEQIFYSFLSTTKTIYRLFSFRFETSIANPHSIICYHRMRPLSKAGQDFIDLTIGNMQEFASLHKKEQEKTC